MYSFPVGDCSSVQGAELAQWWKDRKPRINLGPYLCTKWTSFEFPGAAHPALSTVAGNGSDTACQPRTPRRRPGLKRRAWTLGFSSGSAIRCWPRGSTALSLTLLVHKVGMRGSPGSRVRGTEPLERTRCSVGSSSWKQQPCDLSLALTQVTDEEPSSNHTVMIQETLQQASVELAQQHHLVVSSDDVEGIETVTVYTQGGEASEFIVYVQEAVQPMEEQAAGPQAQEL